MDDKRYQSYGRRLRAKEQELIAEIARMEADGRASEEASTQDLADRADHSYNKETLFQQLDYNRFLLSLVQEALRRGEKGLYGVCVECGKPVEHKRLEAVPWARHCFACQQLQEKGLL